MPAHRLKAINFWICSLGYSECLKNVCAKAFVQFNYSFLAAQYDCNWDYYSKSTNR